MTSCKALTDYIKLVESGKYRVCKEQFLLIKLVKNAFETENIYVDEEQLEKYLALQKYFPYKLFEWEKFVFALHNCTYIAPGILRWPDAVIVVGRGAGKNGYLSFEDFCLMTPINGIKEYHIDICATAEDQAKISFNDILSVLEDNEKKLSKHFKWNKKEITNIKTGSIIKFRTSNSATKDGGRPGKVDFDEYHAYENYKLITVFKTGLGKKAQPRTTITTTMGDVRDGPLDHLLDDLLDILNGVIPDNGTLPFICRLDADEEVNDPLNWYKANPSLQYFPELLRTLQKEYREYQRDNFGNADFMTKRMNRPIGSNEVPVTEWENIKATNQPMINLIPYPCVFGIDYMKTTDFLAVGLLFKVNGKKYWITHTWVCKSCKDLSRIRFPIQDAVAKNYITMVDSVEIPPEVPCEWIAEMGKIYKIVGGAVDNYRYSILRKALEEIGFDARKDGRNNLKLVRPSDIMQVAPIISSDFANHRIVFGEHPLMRWYTNNAKIIYDSKGNMTYGKIEPKTRKTDGFMAYVHAETQEELIDKNKPISKKTKKLINKVYTY